MYGGIGAGIGTGFDALIEGRPRDLRAIALSARNVHDRSDRQQGTQRRARVSTVLITSVP